MQSDFLNQALSLVGAACILVGYVGHQLECVKPDGIFYNVINAIGAGILAWVTLHPFKIGFVILEFAWVCVTLYALSRRRARHS